MIRNDRKAFAMQILSKRLAVCDGCSFKQSAEKFFDKIDEGSPWVCASCPNYLKMRALADQLWDSKLEIRQVLDKGSAMSEQDILYLFDEGVTERRIQEALEIDADAMKVVVWKIGK